MCPYCRPLLYDCVYCSNGIFETYVAPHFPHSAPIRDSLPVSYFRFLFLPSSFSASSSIDIAEAYASEVCGEEYWALVLSVVSTSRGIGLIIGLAIRGFFVQPVEKYPNLFAESSIFVRFTYFQPCLIISVYAVGSLIACKWLPETLHKYAEKANERADLHDISEHSSNDSGQKDNIVELEDKQIHKSNLLKNWPLMSTIIVYCVFSLQ
uniref:Major facilitator superfamily (MFS) profile domain-containing protein n=1 Tax=Gossypium raimondii TaxID=29730 RepID=A0A0D2SY79_GOSRA|nr:hypothetical protein B456_008G009000 [Gossypium raimondii]